VEWENRLVLGDNLEVLRDLPDGYVDLCYIDPPFFTQQTFYGYGANKENESSFSDNFEGMDHYISWLGERVKEIWRVLKGNGSLYVHCDHHGDAYIRVNILDKLPRAHFINHIIWQRTMGFLCATKKTKRLRTQTDTIFLYTKGENYTFNYEKILPSLSKDKIKKHYPYADEKGLFDTITLDHRPHVGRKISEKKRYEYRGIVPKYEWRVVRETMEEWDRNGEICISKHGNLRRKIRPENGHQERISNIWKDCTSQHQNTSAQLVGYPTQKPLKLLERIITLGSNAGDFVLDAFCGSGTTCVAAATLGRKFLGIDQSKDAIRLASYRLGNTPEGFGVEDSPSNCQKLLFTPQFSVIGI
jgi:DNA modification methylase